MRIIEETERSTEDRLIDSKFKPFYFEIVLNTREKQMGAQMTSYKNHSYWIATGIVLLLIILLIYPSGIYNSLTIEITRKDAIKIARDFLSGEKINTDGFFEEAFIDTNPVENKYILKELGIEEFKKIQRDTSWPTRGWLVMIHQNLSKELPQTSYSVNVSHDGNVLGFRQHLPATKAIKSVDEKEALSLISDYISNNAKLDLTGFSLIQNKQDNLGNRIDYAFKWEKKAEKIDGKWSISGFVNGDHVGGYSYKLEVPETEKKYFETGEALFSTGSVIFVIFLMMIAFFLFLKKYHQGEVWLSVGRNLFIIYFIFSILEVINLWPSIGRGATVGDLSFGNTKIIVAVVSFIFNFFISLLLFASWSVGESYARNLWSEKLRGIDGFIKGHLTSISTGSALMKGMVLGIGYTLINLLVPLILDKPHASIFVSATKNLDTIYGGYLPGGMIVLEAFLGATLSSIAISFFIINISYQRWKKKWISILLAGFVTMFGVVIAETPPSLNNLALDLLSYFIFGCAIGYIYFLFDVLTIGSMFFHAALLSAGFLLFAGGNSFYQYNFLFVVIAFLTTPVIYAISRIQKEEFVLENYGLPSHIQRISEREKLKKELEIAAKVQLSLLPKEEPKIPGYEFTAISIPAIEAGGDYFDFVKLSGDKLGIAIGDVSGKGVGAAIYMTLTKGILQAHAEEDVSPKNVLGKVNRLLYKTIEKNTFVSMFYAILDTRNHKILYARAGHNPGILCSSKSGGTKLLLSKGMALGLEEGGIFTSTLCEEEISVDNGDVFVLYTDGFTEAMNERHEEYSEERFVRLIENNKNLSARELLNLILKEIKKFVDNYPQHDDMTILVMKRL